VTLVPALHSSSFQKSPDARPPTPATRRLRHPDQGRADAVPHGRHRRDRRDEARRRALQGRSDAACIGGHFTMDPRRGGGVALVKPKQVVPMHFGTFPLLPARRRAQGCAQGCRPKATVVEMQVGRPRRSEATASPPGPSGARPARAALFEAPKARSSTIPERRSASPTVYGAGSATRRRRLKSAATSTKSAFATGFGGRLCSPNSGFDSVDPLAPWPSWPLGVEVGDVRSPSQASGAD
jgi:hypothetical protein